MVEEDLRITLGLCFILFPVLVINWSHSHNPLVTSRLYASKQLLNGTIVKREEFKLTDVQLAN